MFSNRKICDYSSDNKVLGDRICDAAKQNIAKDGDILKQTKPLVSRISERICDKFNYGK